jgi:hypothetical protein
MHSRIQSGDPVAIRTGIMIARHIAKLNGLDALKRSETTKKNQNKEVTNSSDWRVPNEDLDLMFSRITHEEKCEVLRIYSKMTGMSVVEEGTTGPHANLEGSLEEKRRRLSERPPTIIKVPSLTEVKSGIASRKLSIAAPNLDEPPRSSGNIPC